MRRRSVVGVGVAAIALCALSVPSGAAGIGKAGIAAATTTASPTVVKPHRALAGQLKVAATQAGVESLPTTIDGLTIATVRPATTPSSVGPVAPTHRATTSSPSATGNRIVTKPKAVAKKRVVASVRSHVLPVGVSTASPLVLPLGDGIGDSVAIRIATSILAPAEPLNSARDFVLAEPAVVSGSDPRTTVRTFSAISPQRVSVDGTTPCNPDDITSGFVDASTCPNVQDVWTLNWNGLRDNSSAVTTGQFAVVDPSGPTVLGVVSAVDVSLQAVVANRPTPFVIAPYPDGAADSVNVSLTGTTYGSVPIPTTGSAQLTDVGGSHVYASFDFTTLATAHALHLAGYALGNYTLTADLVYNGEHRVQSFSVRVVKTEVLAAAVTLSDHAVYPARDGYRDAVAISIHSTTSVAAWLPVSGAIEVLHAGRTVLRIPVVRSNQVVSWNGKLGAATVPGTYLIRVREKGPEGATRLSASLPLTVAQTRVTGAAIAVSATSVFPVVDGYRDSVKFSTAGSSNIGRLIAVTGSVQVLEGTRVLWSTPVRSTGAASVVWNGRDHGAVHPGTFIARVTLRGPDGPAATSATHIVVSAKSMKPVSFSVAMTAAAAYDNMATGSFWAGVTSGSQWLWGCDYSGCATDIAYYSWPLPASSAGYRAVVVHTCTSATDYQPVARFAYTLPSGTILDPVWGLGNDYPSCYYPTTAAPAGAFNGRTLNWLVGNIDNAYLSYWSVDYFEITGIRYVLQ